jgi:hypothetical protein
MAAKILAGVVAALLVTGAGVFVAFSGDAARDTGRETQTVSEGSCCALKAQLACEAVQSACPHQAECAGQNCSSDALAACTGSAVLAVSAKPAGKASCCAD